MDKDTLIASVANFLSGTSPYSSEMQAFWMAIQGSMAVRKGANKDGKLHWFHAFAISVMAGFAGGIFGALWMGRPCGMVGNDLNMAGCILAFIVVNYTPSDIGFKLCNTFVGEIITVSFAQLFRSTALCIYVMVCFETFKDKPSAYYPIPVFGPILYGTMLGNMGGFFAKGFEGHVKDGIPWPIQNGIFCGAFYNFYVHDKTGPLGNVLRQLFLPVSNLLDLDDQTFAVCFVSLWMQVMGILQMPAFFGPTFSPFTEKILSPWKDSSTWNVGKVKSEWKEQSAKQKQVSTEPVEEPDETKKKKKWSKKGKKKKA